MQVLNVKIDDVGKKQALEIVKNWLSEPGKHWIATPNPEMVVKAQNDEEFKKIINSADLSIPDGVGLRLAGVKNRVTGVDLMLDLVKLAAEKNFTVGFLGGRESVAERTSERLKIKYPNLRVLFALEKINDQDLRFMNNDLREKNIHKSKFLNPKSIDLLFVALGHGKQEKWIAEHLPEIPVKVAMGVGGAFDYISGRIPRAPLWVRKLGFEWLFRLAVQPWRIKRQLALIEFVWMIISFRITSN